MSVAVYRLDNGDYVLQGEFASAGIAASALLPGFAVDIKSLFDVARFIFRVAVVARPVDVLPECGRT